MSNYKDLLLSIISRSKIDVKPKTTVLVIWNDEDHLNQWMDSSDEYADGIRIITVPSDMLPMMKPEGIENHDEAAMIGIGLGVKEDYSDVQVIYYLTVKP